jgi:pimeloyl-ACP methyl ester carboxylesterase
MRDPEPSAKEVLTPHASRNTSDEHLQLRVHGDSSLPTLIHLPGLHGDWTLLGPFRTALNGRARFVESTYPRRFEWSLQDYAGAGEAGLLEHGITSGWILGESFSSLVAWQFLARQRAPDRAAAFHVSGLILVGGFVRHPWPWAVRFAHCTSRIVSLKLLRNLCRLYARAARRRCGDCPAAVAELDEFVERRANEADRQVMTCRYTLIAQGDPRPIAQHTTLPVHQLTGAWDPIVPWWQIRPWLRRHCPGYRASRIIWSGDHNVLLSAPRKSADQIMEWIGAPTK